jgi:circadian clock protein KaiC
MMTLETRDDGVSSVSEYGVSNISDNVVVLQLARQGSRLARTITVLKTRASGHDSRVREFAITEAGIVLEESAGTTDTP